MSLQGILLGGCWLFGYTAARIGDLQGQGGGSSDCALLTHFYGHTSCLSGGVGEGASPVHIFVRGIY